MKNLFDDLEMVLNAERSAERDRLRIERSKEMDQGGYDSHPALSEKTATLSIDRIGAFNSFAKKLWNQAKI